MVRTLSIGGATYDLFLTLGEKTGKEELILKAGEKKRVKSVIETCGGGASNTSVGLSRLGCSACFCGVLGSDQWGERLEKTLKKEGVDVSSATVIEGETSSFSIIVNFEGGERTILYTPGVNEHFHDVTFDREKIMEADGIYLNHLSESSCAIEDDIIAMLAKTQTMHLTWNPGGCQIEAGMNHADKKALLKKTTFLLFNKEEALEFTQSTDLESATKKCLAAGVRYLCVTDGKNGVIATDGKKTYRCPVAKVPVIDTTGAGDAFGTGATWALLKGFPLPEALKAGTLNAASVVSRFGAQTGLLTEKEIVRMLKETPLVVS